MWRTTEDPPELVRATGTQGTHAGEGSLASTKCHCLCIQRERNLGAHRDGRLPQLLVVEQPREKRRRRVASGLAELLLRCLFDNLLASTIRFMETDHFSGYLPTY